MENRFDVPPTFCKSVWFTATTEDTSAADAQSVAPFQFAEYSEDEQTVAQVDPTGIWGCTNLPPHRPNNNNTVPAPPLSTA